MAVWHGTLGEMIDTIALKLLRLPLKVPYKLAFGKVTQFDTILAHVSADGSEGVGEATILTGYTDETIESSWTCALETARKLPGSSNESAKVTIANGLKSAPFTATALTTAIEMLERHPALQVEQPTRVPLLAGINGLDEDGISDEIEKALAAGFGTLKIKVGFDVESDLQRVRYIQDCNAGRARLRIDANQGYGRDDGCRFASHVDPEDIELLEQPCHADDWDSLEAVSKVTCVPLMLDESIYSEADIERAARIGAAFVKLKLMKCVSLTRLEVELALIRELGMEPVLGNGVASDIGCWMEACVARRQIRSAGEMNGFLRQAEPLSHPPLQVESGSLQLSPGDSPQLDERTLEKVTIQTARFDKTSQMSRTAT
jgi:L-alanine-DL-glutamate epimerase-like enolase superfamily enzyme